MSLGIRVSKWELGFRNLTYIMLKSVVALEVAFESYGGEDRTLVAEFDAGAVIPEMARKHLRTQSSIRLRLEKLGKIQPTNAQ